MIKCIAIDDEPLALRQIKSYIEKCQELTLLGTFTSSLMAHHFLSENDVDLIFVDINMPDLNGVDLVKSLNNPPMVVFTTAYSEYALDGFRLEAIDYLLKPFGLDDLKRAVQRAVSLQELKDLKKVSLLGNTPIAEAEAVMEDETLNKDIISVKADHKVTVIRTANIVMVESEGEYVRLHMDTGTKIVTLFRLKNMEDMLPGSSFIRIHRSYIVNINHVNGYTKGRVFLDNSETLPIGDLYRKNFQELAKDKFMG